MKNLPILTLLTATLCGAYWLCEAHLASRVRAAEEATETRNAPFDDAGKDSPEVAEESPTPNDARSQTARAVELLDEAQNRLLDERRLSVRAKFQQTVSIGDRKFRTTGSYTTGHFPKLRLEFDVSVGDTAGKLLEICDGHLLWTVREIRSAGDEAPTVQISRTVINEVLDVREKTIDVPETLLIARMGVGGLPALLASLQRSMVFDGVKSAEHEGRPHSVIQGRWNDEYRELLGGAENRPLPEHVPDRVRIYFDQETLFPTRIVYLKEAPGEPRLPSRTLLSLDFSDVVLDGPVREDQFRYVPPSDGIQVHNRTSEILGLIEAAKSRAAGTTADP